MSKSNINAWAVKLSNDQSVESAIGDITSSISSMNSLYNVVGSPTLLIGQDREKSYIMINADDALEPLSLNYTFEPGYNTENSNFKLFVSSNNLTTFTLQLGSYEIQVPPNTASIAESGSSIARYGAGVPATLKTNNTYLINFANFNPNVILVIG